MSRTDVLFRHLFERTSAGMAFLDKDLRVIETNDEMLRYLHRRSAEVWGRQFSDFLHPSGADRFRRRFRWLTESSRDVVSDHVFVVRPSGSAFPAGVTGVAVRTDQGDHPDGGIVALLVPGGDAPAAEAIRTVSQVQARILEGVAAGVPTVRLSAQLYLSRQGVEYHITQLYRTLKAGSRPALVSRAYALGMFDSGAWPPTIRPEFVKE